MKGKTIFLICFILVFVPSLMTAQKKELAQAETYIKSGKDFDKAEALMTKLLADSANQQNEKIWQMLFLTQQKQYDALNLKLYLKQKIDTASLFNIDRRMFVTLDKLDSVDAMPDRKGRVKLKYREHSGEQLAVYRPNIFNGGIYFLKKQNYKDAYNFLDKYIKTADEPMFKKYKYSETDKRLPQAAYWAMYCGYKMQDAKATLHHAYLALKDTAHYELMLQYLAETYRLEKDTVRYVQSIKEGFRKFPKFQFFFPRLIDHYMQVADYSSALDVCRQALKVDSSNVVFRYALSSVYLAMGKYKECISISDSLIAQNDSLADAYANAGQAWFDQAVELDKNIQVNNKRRSNILACYRKAMPYLQKFRALAPEQKDRWALPLYTVYLNLNMGKEFDEIDKIINKD